VAEGGVSGVFGDGAALARPGSSGPLRIAMVQLDQMVGDLDGNFARIRESLAALRGEADLAVFPECAGSGYPLQDLALRPGFVRDFGAALERLKAWMSTEARSPRGATPAAVVGGPMPGADLPHNAAWLLETDGTSRLAVKHRLPNSEVYDERRVFAPGPPPRPVPFRGRRIGLLICEDLWHGDAARAAADEGAEVLVVANGSHFRVGKQAERVALARRTARALDLPVVYVNQCGANDELVFDGGSFALARSGATVAALGFSPGRAVVELRDLGRGQDLTAAPEARPGPRAERYPVSDPLAQMWRAMVEGLRGYVRKCGFPGVLIGMSGGLDSAVAAAVAADALGPGRVRLVRLPSRITSAASMDDAGRAAALLGIARLDTIPIGPAVAAMEEAAGADLRGPGAAVARENIQSRARGAILMALSNATGWMLLATGNKSEMAVGYATLYGDMNGGFAVLKDAYKTEVRALAAWRNAAGRPPGCLGADGPVVPEEILRKPPSAELAEGQSDEAVLGRYEDLDATLSALVDGHRDPEAAARAAGVPEAYARRVAALVQRAEYKRRQSPPGVVLGARGFDKGWRLPIARAAGL